jgi:predicted nucleotide-binding protein (sugar kinase/HSP70/actin superfamily)
MEKNNRIFCVPRMGKYSNLFMRLFKDLGLNIMETPEITQKTIKLGVKYSPEMICYPFKVTLGSFIECLEAGATDLIMYNNCGRCRYRQYYIMQDLIMKDLNYKFNMHLLKPRSLLFDLKKLNKKNSYLKVIKAIKKCWMDIKHMEDDYNSQINPEGVNIGVIGEIYTILEPKINLDLINRLKKKDVKTHTFINVRALIKNSFGHRRFSRDKDLKSAKKYLDGGELGGHALENIKETLYFTKKKIDGIIHVMPLSCMPESTIEPVLDKICYDTSTPILRLNIDETNSELNMETRVETFVELLKRMKLKTGT